ncbi:hypothetical protein Bhyg_05364 [Pseudolycoriella hygida]|uniref:Uncharacterized protein n=1 Tax=Pseudolycoriella hygida TaxID=35572 RepID=A0A9Q0SAM4_9DIPT|nr:hypothetical protein Bhyg_05364 [Pseudolycoriella hygida]
MIDDEETDTNYKAQWYKVKLIGDIESGYYVPKGYYVIHSDGQQSDHKITTAQNLLLHRLRRSPQFSSSSSSSSSSVSSNGGPVFFHQSSSSQVSPGGISPQGVSTGFIGSINDRFNGDDDDYDDGPISLNNNRPTYSSFQIQTGTFFGNEFNRPSLSLLHSHSGDGIPNRINIHSADVSQLSSSLHPTPDEVSHPPVNGNIVFSQSNNNGFLTQTSGVLYQDGQVQITSHKTRKF